jgi:hypothetical protein
MPRCCVFHERTVVLRLRSWGPAWAQAGPLHLTGVGGLSVAPLPAPFRCGRRFSHPPPSVMYAGTSPATEGGEAPWLNVGQQCKAWVSPGVLMIIDDDAKATNRLPIGKECHQHRAHNTLVDLLPPVD